MEKMLFSTISPARQKLLLRVSGLLNLLLLLYLSLSAGWSVSSVSPGAEILAQDSASHQTFSRGILNKYFGSLACSIWKLYNLHKKRNWYGYNIFFISWTNFKTKNKE